VVFDGEDITGWPPAQIANRGIPRTFQAGKLVPGLTVRENVMSGINDPVGRAAVDAAFHLPFARSKRETAIGERADRVLALVGMEDRDLRGHADSGPGAQAGGLHHPPARVFHRNLSFGETKETEYPTGGRMRKILGVVLLVLLAAGSAFAEGKAEAKEWTVPFLNCLTGPIASIGEYLNWGAQRAAYEINQAGGIKGRPVRVIPVDTAMDPQKGSVEMAKIVENGLVAMGPVPELVIMAAMPIAVENKMMSMTATTSLDYSSKYFPWTVSWDPPTEQLYGSNAAAWAKQFKDLKTVVQFIEPYGPWSEFAAAQAKGLAGVGVKLLKDVDVPSDAITFGPMAVKALEQKPDAITFVCNGEKVAKLIKELKSRGWTKMDHLLIFSSADAPELYTTGGADLDGVQIYNFINPMIDSPRWNAFKAAYQKDHNGNVPPSLSTNYYDALYMIKEAIEKTGVTGDPKKLAEERKKIADYCANVKGFKGIMFTWDMVNGVPTNKPTYLLSINGGQKSRIIMEVRP
jgi:branched-chain amino acid transport system substrate-binding protein